MPPRPAQVSTWVSDPCTTGTETMPPMSVASAAGPVARIRGSVAYRCANRSMHVIEQRVDSAPALRPHGVHVHG